MRHQQLLELFDYHAAPAAPAPAGPDPGDVLTMSAAAAAGDAQQPAMSPGAVADDPDDCMAAAAAACSGGKMRSIVRAHLPKKMTTAVSLYRPRD